MLLDRLLHWRRNRGFGVHSPFAFSFITTVLRDTGCAFYAYPRLDSLPPDSRRDARLLLRIAAEFNPRDVLVVGSGADGSDAPLLLHDSRTRAVVSPSAVTSGIAPERIVRPGSFAEALGLYAARLGEAGAFPFIVAGALTPGEAAMLAGFIRERQERQTVIVFRRPDSCDGLPDSLAASMPHLMLFRARRTVVAVSRPDLPPQTFRIGL